MMPSLVLETSSSSHPVAMECRVWERHPCGLQASCQPIAARGDSDLSWPAQIHDLSVGGMGLVLPRRFERGTGLAIEIPETATAPKDTLLAKVIHILAKPAGQWLHGCAFVSQLSEDELQRLLEMGHGQEVSAPSDTFVAETLSSGKPCQIQEVTWYGSVAGKVVGRVVRRMHLTGSWPLPAGTILKIWFGKTSHAKVRVRVERCYQDVGRWCIDYTFIDPPQAEVLRSFGL